MIPLVFSCGKCECNTVRNRVEEAEAMRKQFEGKQSRKKKQGDAVRSVPSAREPLGEMTWWLSPLRAHTCSICSCSNVLCFSVRPGWATPDTSPRFSHLPFSHLSACEVI